MKKIITVMSFSKRAGAQSYFMGVDDQRVIFFDQLMASAAVPYAKFTVYRNGNIFDTADSGFGDGAFITTQVDGFNNLKLDYEKQTGQPETNWNQKIKALNSFYFLPGDVIEVEWNIDHSDEKYWLSKLSSTNRQYGACFVDVFNDRKGFIYPILDRIGLSFMQVVNKNVIFASSPFDAEDLQKYY